ncbi:hypothetical protein F183_A21220 [Bryobacterales bacterium F-183]|nr:hypothetical protein F183_A21220 [Bryobacterales bacterium F-183]
MKNFDTRVYSISDFLEWRKNNILDISPEFQRRGVWTRAAKSFLIDTVIRGKPIPKLLITQSLKEQRNIRTVVDGQQRIRTIFEFISNDFTILKAHNDQYARKTFSELPEDIQNEVLKYEIGVDVLFDVGYKDLLDIFARINTYSVVLNPQEKLNARYLGVFKTYAYELGRDYVDYFVAADILTRKQISRMAEAQLSSDLLIILCDGVQTVKNIEKFYRKYETAEDVPEELRLAKEHFHQVMAHIGGIYKADDLKNTNWCRPHLFYSMFATVAHSLFGVGQLPAELRPSLNDARRGHWRGVLDEVSAQYDMYTDEGVEDVPADYLRFIDFARRRTTDTDARIERSKFMLSKLA